MEHHGGVLLTLPVGTRDHIQGSAHAQLTLVEYGDYECPHCARAYPIIKAVQRRLGSKLRFVYRNFPLVNLHPHAEPAAEMAEAAAAQGKFWEMHDALFENQRALEIEDLIGYATQLGLDVARVASELERRLYLPRVKEDFVSGTHSGVNGTPTFFINGARFDGPWDEHGLLAALSSQAEG
jgi:protein-disulfide isomerase